MWCSSRLSGDPFGAPNAGVGGKSCVSGSLWGSPDTKWPFGRTRFRPRMSLARLRLHRGQRSADASLRSLDVAGSDPPSRQTSIGTGEDGAGQPIPPAATGSLPASSPSRKGVERRFEAAADVWADRLAVGLPGIADQDRDAPVPARLSPSRMGLLVWSDPWQAGTRV